MSIYEQVLTFIHRPAPESFQGLSLNVFRHQFEAVAAYRRYARGVGVDPGRCGLWTVSRRSVMSHSSTPTLRSTVLQLSAGAAVFLTSGTTQGRERRGRHIVARPEIYRASATAHLRTMLFPDARRVAMLAIHPTADVMPESSLAAMVSWCIEEFATRTHLAAASRDSSMSRRRPGFLPARNSARTGLHPGDHGCVCGVVFRACLTRRKLRLAPGSRMMDTGGAKGQAVPMQAAEVVARAGELLTIAPEMVINEYGMTELCSQLYDATAFNCPGGRILKSATRFRRRGFA